MYVQITTSDSEVSGHLQIGKHPLWESTLNTRAIFQLKQPDRGNRKLLSLPLGAQPGSRLQHRQLILWAGFKIHQNCTVRIFKKVPLLSFQTSFLFTADWDAKPSINLWCLLTAEPPSSLPEPPPLPPTPADLSRVWTIVTPAQLAAKQAAQQQQRGQCRRGARGLRPQKLCQERGPCQGAPLPSGQGCWLRRATHQKDSEGRRRRSSSSPNRKGIYSQRAGKGLGILGCEKQKWRGMQKACQTRVAAMGTKRKGWGPLIQ